MICLTGDVHHMSLGTGNQAHCDITEAQTAQRFVELVAGAGVKVTLFVSGKCFAEEWDDVRPLCESPAVEIGGHNWSCLTPQLWHRAWNKLTGSYNGPAWYQRRDCARTIRIIEEKSGRRIRCWRNHMYMHGPHTERVLAGCGIRACSDGVRKAAVGPTWHETGLMLLPINVIPDHEHVYHAERTPEWVAWWVKRYGWSDDFGSESYSVERWCDLVLDGLRQNEARGALSCAIIHPITMYLCDRFASFRRILDFVRTCETATMGEIHDREAARRGASRERP